MFVWSRAKTVAALALGAAAATAALTLDAEAATASVRMLDRLGAQQGTAKLNLVKGTARIAAALPSLPATVDTGDGTFDATIYRAYLASSIDPALEVPLGGLYPNTKGKVTVKAAFRGDLSRLGLDRVVVVAFSKDGQSSFDVLTGTIPTQ